MAYKDISAANFFKLKKNPPHDKVIRLYNKKKRRHKPNVKHPKEHQYTNNELAAMIANLSKNMNASFKRVNTRIDDTNKRIDQLETHINRIDAHLDYIIKANNLKDLPEDKKKS